MIYSLNKSLTSFDCRNFYFAVNNFTSEKINQLKIADTFTSDKLNTFNVGNFQLINFFLILFLFIFFLNYVYTNHINKIFGSEDFRSEASSKNLFRLVDSNFKTERARNLLNLTEIRESYYKKLAAVKTSGGLTSITGFNTTFVSHAFFNVIEFTVAEKCILCAYTLNKIQKPGYLKPSSDLTVRMFEDKIANTIHDYVMIWPKNEHAAAFSLFSRIMKNLCYITEESTFEILDTIKKIYEKRFHFKAHHFIHYIKRKDSNLKPDCSLFFENNTFWKPDLELKLKNLSKMNI
jgi:hypothetical protein